MAETKKGKYDCVWDRPLLSDTGGGGVKLAPRDFG